MSTELWMNGECSADLEPVLWVQGGTFGYIDKHSNSTGNQRSPIALTHHSLPLQILQEVLYPDFQQHH